MKKDITFQDLNNHYAGKINLKENKRIFEDGTKLNFPHMEKTTYAGVPGINTQKIDKVIAYFYDIDLKPVTFQLDYLFNVVFNNAAITEEYNKNEVPDDVGDTTNTTTEPTNAQIAAASKEEESIDNLSFKLNEKDDETIADLNAFYHDYFTKKLPTYAISKKLRDLIREGKLNMGEFEIVALNYSQLDDKTLFNQFSANHGKDIKYKKLPYGYSITIGAKSGHSEINTLTSGQIKTELTKFTTYFTEIFEKEILTEKHLFSFVK